MTKSFCLLMLLCAAALALPSRPIRAGDLAQVTPAEGEDWVVEVGSKALVIDLAIGGDLPHKLSESGQVLDFFLHGARVFRYGPPSALDALGAEIPVRMEAAGDFGVRLVLERGSDAGPVVVRVPLSGPKAGRIRSRTVAGFSPEAAPANDTCSGAAVIPPAGPFPHTSALAVITDATTTGDPVARPACALPAIDPARSVWYSFAPAETASYTLSTCAESGTTVDDTVLAVYTSTGGCAGPFTQVSNGCSDDVCEPFLSFLTLTLAAGTTYYAVVWTADDAPETGADAVALRVGRVLAAPANDTCAGGSAPAYTIPPAGPFPYLTSTTADITDATTAGDPPAPSCLESGLTATRSTWYTFAPASSGTYLLSSCAADEGGTATTVDDTLIAVYTSTGGCAGPFTEIATAGTSDGCDDDTCGVESLQAILRTDLVAGTSYYVLVHKVGAGPPTPGNTAVQLRIARVLTPLNDVCLAAAPLPLHTPVSGTTANAFDDYRAPATAACFSGIGQSAPTSVATAGTEVVYFFTPPETDRYSFKVTDYLQSNNLVLYVASDCPIGSTPATASCLAGADRNTSLPSEEVKCLSLTGGTTVWVYVDERQGSAGSTFTLEVSRCRQESEPNDTPAQANTPACGIEASIFPGVDADFYSLGVLPAGTRVFALAEAVSGNTSDVDLRVTTASDTLEYDDLDADTPFGPLAATCDGTPLTAVASYLRVNSFQLGQVIEPYRLYATLQPPAAQPETEPNDSIAQAQTSPAGYFAGTLAGTSPSTDQDLYSFQAAAGDLVFVGLDGDPLRDNTPLNARLSLLDGAGGVLVTVDDIDATSDIATTPGTLAATRPRSPGEALVWRARSTGTYLALVQAGSLSGSPRAGNYLLSIAIGCASTDPALDTDDDGISDFEDCAPGDPTAFALPGEVTGLAFPSGKTMLAWSPSGGGSGATYDLLRGLIGSLPVGPGGADETCTGDLTTPTTSDTQVPAAGSGVFYLVRGANACGAGSYGRQGTRGVPGALRSSSTCP